MSTTSVQFLSCRQCQLKRVKQREEIPYKRDNITNEDWRKRKKWSVYKSAVNEMVIRTSTARAPWKLIPANDKPYARIDVLKTTCKQLCNALGSRHPKQ